MTTFSLERHSDLRGFYTPNSDIRGFIRIWGVLGSAIFAYGGGNPAVNSYMGGGQIRLWGGAVVKFGCEGDKLPKPHQIRMWWFDPHQNRMTKTKCGAVYPHRK